MALPPHTDSGVPATGIVSSGAYPAVGWRLDADLAGAGIDLADRASGEDHVVGAAAHLEDVRVGPATELGDVDARSKLASVSQVGVVEDRHGEVRGRQPLEQFRAQSEFVPGQRKDAEATLLAVHERRRVRKVHLDADRLGEHAAK